MIVALRCYSTVDNEEEGYEGDEEEEEEEDAHPSCSQAVLILVVHVPSLLVDLHFRVANQLPLETPILRN